MSFKNYPVFNVFESLLSLFQVLSKLGVYRDQNKFENPARPEAVVYISPDVPHGLKNYRYNFFILFSGKNTTLNFLKHILRACFCIFFILTHSSLSNTMFDRRFFRNHTFDYGFRVWMDGKYKYLGKEKYEWLLSKDGKVTGIRMLYKISEADLNLKGQSRQRVKPAVRVLR